MVERTSQSTPRSYWQGCLPNPHHHTRARARSHARTSKEIIQQAPKRSRGRKMVRGWAVLQLLRGHREGGVHGATYGHSIIPLIESGGPGTRSAMSRHGTSAGDAMVGATGTATRTRDTMPRTRRFGLLRVGRGHQGRWQCVCARFCARARRYGLQGGVGVGMLRNT